MLDAARITAFGRGTFFYTCPLDGRCMRRYDERECHARRNRGGARMTTDEECWPFFFFFFFECE